MGTVTPPMDFPRVQQGAVIDGFVVGERVHKGGMSAVWHVTQPQISMPMIMKVPSLVEGEDAAAIVGIEMEHMILPRLQGTHVPKFVAAGLPSRGCPTEPSTEIQRRCRNSGTGVPVTGRNPVSWPVHEML